MRMTQNLRVMEPLMFALIELRIYMFDQHLHFKAVWSKDTSDSFYSQYAERFVW